MTEFWENAFNNRQEMWGMTPTKSAQLATEIFKKNGIKNILIPGIGYGRNAKPFLDNGIHVSGIEISQTAIELAHKHYGERLDIFNGPVTQMPFNDKKYEGIFCHALIHLLDDQERKKLIQNCYAQLIENGYMIFTAVTKQAPEYGKGELLGKDRYEVHKGAAIFYYDKESVKKEFEAYGPLEVIEVTENQPMYLIKCKKKLKND
ncbi:class I SAM-dependent methyltransferase [Maribacter litoralis]|uniref:Methyltransferase domain-containing protein n=1 Tax=Maribacter litoralis TaxID=2059726 RepID=A0A653W1Y0_9FLAO|nr:class I SAM-dependent methyltransferase [Maribacter litoralis]VXC07786.1 Methyltransferase domain-containing protein [Maribacter litoralis]